MLQARTLKILAALLAGYALLAMLGLLGPPYLEAIGAYAFLVLFWIGVAWLTAWGLARVSVSRSS